MARTLFLAILLSWGIFGGAQAAMIECLDGPRIGQAPAAALPGDRAAKLELESERVEAVADGPLMTLTVTQTFRYRGKFFSPGDEASLSLRTSHLAALFDYWITEEGVTHRGIVRDSSSARKEYDANVSQRRDPGLAEWKDEGLLQLSLYPVLRGGVRKDQGFTLAQVLPVDSSGVVTLHYDLPVYGVGRTEWRLRFPRGIPRRVSSTIPLTVDPAAPDTLVGRLTGLPVGTKSLDVRYGLPGLDAPELVWVDPSKKRFLMITPTEVGADAASRPIFVAWMGPIEMLDALAVDRGRRVAAGRARVIGDSVVWGKLEASIRTLALSLDGGQPLAAMDTARMAAIVAPGVVLFANPFATQAGIDAGWKAARRAPVIAPSTVPTTKERLGLSVRPPGFQEASPRSTPSLVGFWPPVGELLVPNFKCARERSCRRACLANQKTLAGAIEMYELDRECKVMGHVLHNRPCRGMRHTHEHTTTVASPKPKAPPPGVFVSYWRHGIRREFHSCDDPTCPEAPWAPCADRTCHLTENRKVAARIPPWLFAILKSGGYLQSVPLDPGGGAYSSDHYCLVPWGNGIFCLWHGEIQPRIGHSTTARAQLESEGIVDPAILAAALDYVLHPPSRPLDDLAARFAVFVFAVACPVFLFTLLRRSARQTAAILKGAIGGTVVFAVAYTVAVPLGAAFLAVVPLGFLAGQVIGTVASLMVRGLFGLLAHLLRRW